MASTADFRNGMVLKHKGDYWSIVEFQHVKPGKGGAFVRTKLKRLRTGQVVEDTFRAGEKLRRCTCRTPRRISSLYCQWRSSAIS